jgi:hypothetical protein
VPSDDVFIWAPPNSGTVWKKQMRICSDCGRVCNVDDPIAAKKTHPNFYRKPCFGKLAEVTMNTVHHKNGNEVELPDA